MPSIGADNRGVHLPRKVHRERHWVVVSSNIFSHRFFFFLCLVFIFPIFWGSDSPCRIEFYYVVCVGLSTVGAGLGFGSFVLANQSIANPPTKQDA